MAIKGITTEEYRETVQRLVSRVVSQSVGKPTDQLFEGIPEACDDLDSALLSAIFAVLPGVQTVKNVNKFVTPARKAFRRQLRARVS